MIQYNVIHRISNKLLKRQELWYLGLLRVQFLYLMMASNTMQVTNCLLEPTFLNSVMSGNEILDEKIKEWLQWDRNEFTFNEIKKHVLATNYDDLAKMLLTRLDFGTAGLRGAMGAGFSRMNDLTIIQTTQGLHQYLTKEFVSLKNDGVVIGHDARHGSHRFARLAAAVFLHAGVKVYLFSDIVPTPYVPFSVLKYKCSAGIMVTASHNPKEDNGYKVYYSNGCQLNRPHDKRIAQCIFENLVPLESSWDESFHKVSELCIDPLDEVHQDYLSVIQKHCYNRSINASSQLNITYTAMHGVGEKYEVDAFKAFSLKPFFSTEAQAKPDPDFPTVKLPNPEEGLDALKLAIKTAEANSSPIIIAHDPDADRLAMAEKLKDGSWKVFTGNEIAFLLGWWAFINYKKSHGENFPKNSVIMLYSTVSSRVLKTMAEIEGFLTEETLCGFKWTGNKSLECLMQGKTVLFAFEEALGYMFGTQVLDKDGISASVVASELACVLYNEGTTLSEKLEQLNEKYGLHLSHTSYFICYDQVTIKNLFQRIREANSGKYPDYVGPYKVKHVRDLYGSGFDSSQPGNKPIFPTSTSGQLLTFTFEDGCVASIRTSGTEPKIKYYTEIYTEPSDRMTLAEAQMKMNNLTKHIIEELLQPEQNHLISR
ncbi:phosphopentomutase isoform X2 [Hydra vulgaris]|uniref:phosphopentomutase isoform X2 n=1 Tax=Hydra vulgaris TaxID=6087 RepID=UPI001F5EC185|nr:phosphoglucomutase-2 isoform X2 [Hydra vulgaris]